MIKIYNGIEDKTPFLQHAIDKNVRPCVYPQIIALNLNLSDTFCPFNTTDIN